MDASFFVATESGRQLADAPDVTETEVSVITLAELTVGVLMADDTVRPDRLATPAAVESAWDPLPVDVAVSRAFARIVADLRAGGRHIPILDALVAATALVEEIPVIQDRDYDSIPGVQVIRVLTDRGSSPFGAQRVARPLPSRRGSTDSPVPCATVTAKSLTCEEGSEL